MIRKTFFAILAILGLCIGGYASDPKPSVGIVNFAQCMTDSKLGKKEQESFETLKNKMTSLLEDADKQLNELAAKFNDAEYMDGLSPEAEEEMKNKYRTLSEEMNRYQNQYYQTLNQANMKIIQTMGANIQEASEKVAKSQKLNMVMNKEACFFHNATLDVTHFVIKELDRSFDEQNAKNQKQNVQNVSKKK